MRFLERFPVWKPFDICIVLVCSFIVMGILMKMYWFMLWCQLQLLGAQLNVFSPIFGESVVDSGTYLYPLFFCNLLIFQDIILRAFSCCIFFTNNLLLTDVNHHLSFMPNNINDFGHLKAGTYPCKSGSSLNLPKLNLVLSSYHKHLILFHETGCSYHSFVKIHPLLIFYSNYTHLIFNVILLQLNAEMIVFYFVRNNIGTCKKKFLMPGEENICNEK